MSSSFRPVLSESEGWPTFSLKISVTFWAAGTSNMVYGILQKKVDPKEAKNQLVFGPISAVGTTSCLLIARAPLRGRHTSRENPL